MIATIKKQKEDMSKGEKSIDTHEPKNTVSPTQKPVVFGKSLNSKDIRKEYNQV